MTQRPSRAPRPRRERLVLVVAFPGVELLDVAGPASVFSTATRLVGPRRAGYRVEIAALKPGPVVTQGGVLLQPTVRLGQVREPVDTLLVPGGEITMRPDAEPDLPPHLRALAARSRRVASVCTGSFLLARAGLLEGKRATTHWLACDALQRQHPGCEVLGDRLFVREGRLWTSAGVTSGIDLALAMLEEDLGRELAREVARLLVVYLRRPGGQSQFSVQLASQWAERAPLREVQEWLPEHLREDLSVEALARRAAMSPRNFARAFREQIGVTPARYVERMRVEAARAWLESSAKTV